MIKKFPIFEKMLSSLFAAKKEEKSDVESVAETSDTDNNVVHFLVGQKGTMPKKGTNGSAGWDIYASEDVKIPALSRSLIPTDLKMAFPPTMVAYLKPRSSLAVKGIDVGAGVIDSDYRHEIKVLLINTTGQDFSVTKGDRIAQLIFHHLACVSITSAKLLPASERTGGFGSTGK
jgi:dUTP pyrophosphatase